MSGLTLTLLLTSFSAPQAPLFSSSDFLSSSLDGGSGISGIVLGSFAGNDTKPDLLTLSASFGSANVFANGGGTTIFSSPTTSFIGFPPPRPAVADYNGDGVDDLAVYLSSSVFLLLGSLGGQISRSSFVPLQYFCPESFIKLAVPGDRDGDGDSDVFVCATTSGACGPFWSQLLGYWLENSGTGQIISSQVTMSKAAPLFVAGDLNGDGKKELVLAGNPCAQPPFPFPPCNSFDISISALEGTTPSIGILQSPEPPTTLGLTDFNSDGLLDIVITGGSTVRVGLNSSSGTIGALTPIATISGQASSSAFGDLDGDGLVDLVASVDQNIEILPRSSPTTFTAPVILTCASAVKEVEVADLDADAAIDIVALLTLDPEVVFYRNRIGSAGSLVPYGTGTPGCNGSEVLSAQSLPIIGNSAFTLKTTNVPPSSTGAWLLTDAQDLVGSDPLFVGVKLHVDLFASSEIIFVNSTSGATGVAVLPAPIPNVPSLAGKKYYGQSLWSWPLSQCLLFPYGLSSSTGLAITIVS